MLATAKQTVKNALNLVGIKAAKSVIYNAIKLYFSSNKITYIASGGYLHLSKPNMSSGVMHRSFLENFIYPTPAIFVAELPKGYVAKKYNLTGVFSKDLKLFRELSFDPMERKLHPLCVEKKLPTTQKIKGKVLMLYTPSAGKSYFMWLVDLIPKFGMIKAAGYELSEFERIIINPLSFQSQHDMLDFLGVDKNKLLFLNDEMAFEADTMIVPSPVGRNPYYFKYIRNLFMTEAPSRPEELVYISRKKAIWRNTINEQDVLATLAKYGFNSYVLEELSYIEQMNVFSRAKHIVSSHGAGLANLLFCSPQSTLIEFIARHHNNVNFWILASYAQMNYYCIECNSELGASLPPHLGVEYHDIEVDINVLEKTLSKALNL